MAFINTAQVAGGTSDIYCGLNGHVRVWAGGADAKPNTCACGAVKYVTHRCVCGDEHEQAIPNEPYRGEVISRFLTPNL